MASEYEYLVAAANQIFILLNRSPIPTQNELSEAANLGCNALQRLSNDEIFFRDVATLGSRLASNLRAFRRITGVDNNSLSHFLTFWEGEKSLLIRAGFSEEVIELISTAIEETINGVRRGRLSVDELRILINRVRDLACRQAQRLHEQTQESEEVREESRRQLQRILYALIGAAVVALDASTLAPSVGLTTAGTAVSGAFGAALMGVAVPPIQ